MCKVYNVIGSLTAVKAHLQAHNADEFKSVNELIDFQKRYIPTRQQIVSNHTLIIEQEKNTLSLEIAQLNDAIKLKKSEVHLELQLELEKLMIQLENLTSTNSNVFRKFARYIKKTLLEKKIRNKKQNLNSSLENSVKPSISLLAQKDNRYQYIISQFDEAVNKSSSIYINELERKKKIIDEINTSIYGVIGEQKVVKELEKLSDDYILINDFNCSFRPAIYNRQENDYISSIQIDHLLISPAGIFLIETKNWSETSLNNLSLRSPVQQIKRTGFALFKILTGTTRPGLMLNQHHWGNKKIPIKNLIVLINKKPNEEFEFVKVLSLNELIGYVKYFKPAFTKTETEEIANFLLSITKTTLGD